jgi:hypothetical protein
VPYLLRWEVLPNRKMLPSGIVIFPNISLAISNNSDREEFSTHTMRTQSSPVDKDGTKF